MAGAAGTLLMSPHPIPTPHSLTESDTWVAATIASRQELSEEPRSEKHFPTNGGDPKAKGEGPAGQGCTEQAVA